MFLTRNKSSSSCRCCNSKTTQKYSSGLTCCECTGGDHHHYHTTTHGTNGILPERVRGLDVVEEVLAVLWDAATHNRVDTWRNKKHTLCLGAPVLGATWKCVYGMASTCLAPTWHVHKSTTLSRHFLLARGFSETIQPSTMLTCITHITSCVYESAVSAVEGALSFDQCGRTLARTGSIYLSYQETRWYVFPK